MEEEEKHDAKRARLPYWPTDEKPRQHNDTVRESLRAFTNTTSASLPDIGKIYDREREKQSSASRPEHRHFLSRIEARTHRSPPIPDVVCCAPPQTSCAAFGVLKCLKPTLSIKSLHDFRWGMSENPFRFSASRDFVAVGIKANLCL